MSEEEGWKGRVGERWGVRAGERGEAIKEGEVELG